MRLLRTYSAILICISIVIVYGIIDILFKESLNQILFEIGILLIFIIPLVYFLAYKIVKLETENKMLHEKEELIRLSTEHAVLYELSNQFLKTYDTNKIMDIAVKTIHDFFNSDFAEILMYDEKKNNLILTVGIGWSPEYIGIATVHVSAENQAGHTLIKRKPSMVIDFSSENRFIEPEFIVRNGVKSSITAPLIAASNGEEKAIGVIGVSLKKPHEFISKDLWFLTLLANETAAALEKAKLHEDIKATNTFLHSVLEGIGEGVIVIDREYRIVAANSAYINQHEPEDQVIGMHCYKVSHHSEKACYELGNSCPVQKTFETGKPAYEVHTHHASSGKAFHVEVQSYPLRDDSGNVTKVVETTTDITERIELEGRLIDSEKRYRDLYNNAPDMYCSIDNNGVVIECNNTLSKTLGYKKEEITGKPITFFSDVTPQEMASKLAALKKKDSLIDIECHWKTNDDRQLDIIVNATAFYDNDGNLFSISISGRDITAKTKTEEELKKKIKELEDFYNIAVDRELRMIELKNEIEKLKGIAALD